MATPVITIVGYSNSGKTTVATELIRILDEMGYKIAAVKHCPHGHDIDREGSDTQRMALAGASAVVSVSPDKLTRIEWTDTDSSLQRIAATLNGFNLVIAEGFKDSAAPKVVIRKGGCAVSFNEGVFAIVTDEIESDSRTLEDADETHGPSRFKFNEMYKLATYIRDSFL